MYVFWHIELCAHDTGLASVMRGQLLHRSFDSAQDYQNKSQCARRTRFQFISKSDGHAENGCLISRILGSTLGSPNETRFDAAGMLVAG